MEKSQKSALILASRPVTAGMQRYVKPGAFVITADAGWKNAEVLGLPVDLAVGDCDSAPEPRHAAETVRLQPEKDDSDTHYAARLALARGFDDFTLLGGLGGRLDHTLANLHTMLFLARGGAAVVAADEETEMHCIGPGCLQILREDWRWVSVFAAGGITKGVDLHGLKYPLSNATLSPDTPLGLSNEFVEETARVCCREGWLYVVMSR